MPTPMDAAAPADAKNAPTGTWKTAQDAVSHSAHAHYSVVLRREERPCRSSASHTEFLTLPKQVTHSPALERAAQHLTGPSAPQHRQGAAPPALTPRSASKHRQRAAHPSTDSAPRPQH